MDKWIILGVVSRKKKSNELKKNKDGVIICCMAETLINLNNNRYFSYLHNFTTTTSGSKDQFN